MPVLSIIIPTLKEGEFLDRTLKNLAELSLAHEIIITDGGSTDETLSIARRYTDKIVVWDKPRRQTFGEAKNAGANLATGEFLVFIDADVLIPSPEAFFEEMLHVFKASPSLVAATTPLKPYLENTSLADAFFSVPLNYFYILSNNVCRIGNSSGEFQMVRTKIFREVGGFEERLAAGEDNDLFRKLSAIGETISYRTLCVRHSLRRSHKLGWIRTYGIWIKNGLSVAFRKKAAYKEWLIVR